MAKECRSCGSTFGILRVMGILAHKDLRIPSQMEKDKRLTVKPVQPNPLGFTYLLMKSFDIYNTAHWST